MRMKKMKVKKTMNKINFFLSIVMVLSLSACGKSNSQTETVTETPPQTEEDNSEKEEKPVEEAIVEEEPVYADDKVVNQFIADYNAISQSEFTDIEKGSIRTKYFAYSYGYYCELLHANDTDKINVTINQTNDNADIGVAGMRDIFHDVAITIDPSLSDEEVYSYFDSLITNEYRVEDEVLGTMSIFFSPDKELSNGHSRGHIEIRSQ